VTTMPADHFVRDWRSWRLSSRGFMSGVRYIAKPLLWKRCFLIGEQPNLAHQSLRCRTLSGKQAREVLVSEGTATSWTGVHSCRGASDGNKICCCCFPHPAPHGCRSFEIQQLEWRYADLQFVRNRRTSRREEARVHECNTNCRASSSSDAVNSFGSRPQASGRHRKGSSS